MKGINRNIVKVCVLFPVSFSLVAHESNEHDEGEPAKLSAVEERLQLEHETQDNPFVLTPHKMNYILPYTKTNSINREAYTSNPSWQENFDDQEAKIQLSIKVPLNYGDMFVEGDALYFGFTAQSWWQIYSDDISAPFRETNYQPELFYAAPTNWTHFDHKFAWGAGVEHQSNGRSEPLSRSWNRAYLLALWEQDNTAFAIRPWVRISESAEDDDNPDIDDYMGNFEATAAYKYQNIKLFGLVRNNFSTHKGFVELGVTFPIWKRLRGYIQYTDGYGESLIDYNHSQRRYGIGLALTDPI
ncbi:phospholipase A [Vibrio hippocampi]|uniref:Phospholipase A1 n=1 Tax=Vibrio hippocampi TaxID=654686 RepID=A0ABN8DKC8_9VIBR|nr:phospholipase A [Vibrio hippocampi]CAH0529791.1 Phospholipase A1 [Vibrio hippocampi]